MMGKIATGNVCFVEIVIKVGKVYPDIQKTTDNCQKQKEGSVGSTPSFSISGKTFQH